MNTCKTYKSRVCASGEMLDSICSISGCKDRRQEAMAQFTATGTMLTLWICRIYDRTWRSSDDDATRYKLLLYNIAGASRHTDKLSPLVKSSSHGRMRVSALFSASRGTF